MTKKEDYKVNREPHYYIGKLYGYSAKNIVDDFSLSPWTAQAVQYILRAGKKADNTPEQDILNLINYIKSLKQKQVLCYYDTIYL